MKSPILVILLAAVCWQSAAAARRSRTPSIADLQPINILTPTTVSFLKGIPNLFDLCSAIKSIPHGIVIRMKKFLERIVVDIPDDNLLKFHFTNVIFLISTYENIINFKKDLTNEFRKMIDDLEPDTDEPTMFRDVTEAITNPFKDFMKPFDPVAPFVPNARPKKAMKLTKIQDLLQK